MIEWALRWLLKNSSNCYVFLGIVFLHPFIIHLFGQGYSALMFSKLKQQRTKTVEFSHKKLWKLLNPESFFLKIYRFGQGHFPHACKIWAGSDEKWMSSSQKTIIFSEKYFLRFFFDPKTGFWKFTFVGKVILHMPIKFEQARMKNEGGVREKR